MRSDITSERFFLVKFCANIEVMKVTDEDAEHVAKLANIPLAPAEREQLAGQMSKILDYIDKLNGIDISLIDPIYNTSMNKNITRKDIPGKSLTQQETLANGSSTKDGYFVTKGVFEEK